MVTLSEENYLKAIYHLSNHGNISVSTNAIASKMETKASSVTDMIKKLAENVLRSQAQIIVMIGAGDIGAEVHKLKEKLSVAS